MIKQKEDYEKQKKIEGDSDLIYGHSVVYTEDRKKIIRKNVSPKYKDNLMKFGWFPSHQSIYLKSSVFDQCGYFNEDYKIAADYEFLLRVLLVHKLKAKRLDMFLLKFHLGGVSSKNIMSVVESNYECFIAWKNNNLTIEFGIKKNQQIVIFQARPNTISKITENPNIEKNLGRVIEQNKIRYKKFVKKYSSVSKIIEQSVKKYCKDVQTRRFPSSKNVYKK